MRTIRFIEGGLDMSRSDKKADTPSTVEAIRMASASVIGTTTNLGYPLGSAVGTGSMMEENSETVAMNIAPLVFAVRDSLSNAEGLELLSLEWDLIRTPGPGVLPEQLVVAGGISEGVGSHVIVLSWEKGVVDPFKIDTHMKSLSKKIADIESAVISNGMSYETHGLPILRRFNDRLNRVTFVEMLDRQFQGSWDSLQIKPEHVDKEAVVTMNFRDDFTLLPPGPKITERTLFEFLLPREKDEALLRHFPHRVLTPTGLEALAVKVPEAGRAILNELNMYAYSIEEYDIAKAAIGLLAEFLGRHELGLKDSADVQKQLKEFSSLLSGAVNSFSSIAEKHVVSGKTLSLPEHKSELLSQIELHSDDFAGFRHSIANELVEQMMKSFQREFFDVREIRAWRLGSATSYFIIFARRVAQYFTDELSQYMLITSARQAFSTVLHEFQEETKSQASDITDEILFEKFYSELRAQMNAIIDKKTYEGQTHDRYDDMLGTINKEMTEAFGHIDMWDLIGFSDVAGIARDEIAKKYAIEQGSKELHSTGQSISEILEAFESLVVEVIPNVADTLLSKPLLRKTIDRIRNENADLTKELAEFIEKGTQKSDVWKEEARSWIKAYAESVDPQMSAPERILTLLRFVHTKVGLGSTAQAIVDKLTSEADLRERAYQMIVEEWEETCRRLEAENEPIRDNNRKREEMTTQTEIQFKEEMAQYESEMEKYRQDIEAARLLPEDEPQPVIERPQRPTSLDVRLVEINNLYPHQEEKPLPPKPVAPPEMFHYVELRDLLAEKLSRLDEAQERMQSLFADRLEKMQSDAVTASGEVKIELGDDLLEYLIDSRIRGLSRLIPRASRAYLRDPKKPELIYLVTYEHSGNELIVTIGDNYLREGGA
ncbi:MAG: hypothetical protein ACFFD9_08540 [Candidatus Thorarchaeota archaeon]